MQVKLYDTKYVTLCTSVCLSVLAPFLLKGVAKYSVREHIRARQSHTDPRVLPRSDPSPTVACNVVQMNGDAEELVQTSGVLAPPAGVAGGGGAGFVHRVSPLKGRVGPFLQRPVHAEVLSHPDKRDHTEVLAPRSP